jgi:hypothetical protein
MVDIELGRPNSKKSSGRGILRGFPSLSAFIASNSNAESFIFRRFDRLAARNLLYYQSELAYLEKQLDALDAQDYRDYDDEAADCARCWESLEEKLQDGDQHQQRRWSIILRIRRVMHEYRKLSIAPLVHRQLANGHVGKALIEEQQIASLKIPSDETMTAFNHEFYGTVPCLGGISKNMYCADEDNKRDLLQITSTDRVDRMSHFFKKHLVRWLERKQSSSHGKLSGKVAYLAVDRLDFIAEIACALLTTSLLVGAILSLFLVTSEAWRIAIIIVFTVLFSISSVFLADSTRLAIFGASAAYAAVLVVFISNNGNCST